MNVTNRTIIFKPTERCNSNCLYCDFIKVDKVHKSYNELLENLYIRIGEYLKVNKTEKILIVWHGGEICLLGEEIFISAIKLQNLYCSESKERISHHIQSNLTLINQNIINRLKELRIKYISTSYDSISGIRGIGKNINSYEYNRKFVNGVKLVLENRMAISIIYVVHKLSLSNPIKVFRTLTNLALGQTISFIRLEDYSKEKCDLNISTDEFNQFLGEIFPIWLKNRHIYDNIEPFKGIYNAVEHENYHGLRCEFKEDCADIYAYVDPQGDIFHCCSSLNTDSFKYGNILTDTLTSIFQSEKRDIIKQQINKLKLGYCMKCKFWSICKGGCPIASYKYYNNSIQPFHCLKLFFNNYLEKKVSNYEY